jgi:oligopeptide transport system permease protein
MGSQPKFSRIEAVVTTYLIRRLLWLIPVILVVGAVTFILMHNTPGGPWDTDPERRQVDASTVQSLESFYGLDKPLWRQFFAYMIGDFNNKGEFVCGLPCGNFGPSYRQRGVPVQAILFSPPEGEDGEMRPWYYSRFGYSLRLGLIALVIAISIGIPLGAIAALKQNTIVDYVSLLVATAGVSLPGFVIAIFLIIIFASWLDWVDVVPRSWDEIRVWILPAVVLGFGTLAFTARLMRTSMLEVLRQDYIRTARAKGLAEWAVVIVHMVKNALIPVITILGPSLASLVTGSFIIETMFAFPGMGRAYVQAIGQRDYSMIMGTTIIFAVLVAIANLSVDFIYVLVDPRIRLDE